ncbi:MAG TPA: hypothetical protein VLZ56_10215, partial [Mycoplana sp.]|nr:hypothetical protein [Mycoplana sp.]
MSFFRRSEDNGRVAAKYGAERPTVSARGNTAQPVETSVLAASAEIVDYEAFGLALEENKQSSEELVASLSFVQDRVTTLLTAHSRSLNEVGTLRVECARLGSLLEYEGTTRRKLDQDNGRLASENKEVRTDNAQLRVEIDAVRQEYVKLQALHGVTCEELSIIETRLADAEREMSDRSGQFDEATAMVKRTQQELELRGRELATLRERLDVESTAHQLLAETSRREGASQAREMTRLNEERNQLKNTLSQQEVSLRSLQASTA